MVEHWLPKPRVAGSSPVVRLRETGRIGPIDSFYVLPETRGQGVGGRPMEAAYAAMRKTGRSTVALEMVATDEVAKRFYEEDGFTTTLVEMHRFL